MTNELTTRELRHQIYFIRGQSVMLDSDLAQLYNVELRALNQTVKRNFKRFPGDDFIFQLADAEYRSLKSQLPTLKQGRGDHRKYCPLVFTEHGVAMLAGVLNSDRAIEVHIDIIRTFVRLRQGPENYREWGEKLDRMSNRLGSMETKLERLIQIGSSESEMGSDFKFMNLQPTFTSKNTASKVDAIKKAVAKYYNLTSQDLLSATRVQSIAFPRQIAIYLVRKITRLSFQEIGRYFGGKDHTTVLHAYRKIKSAVDGNGNIREDLESIQSEVA